MLTYNTQISVTEFGPAAEEEGVECTYSRRHLLLLPETFGSSPVMLQNLLLQARHIHLYKAPMTELVDEMALRHMEVFGIPEYLVEVRPGLYLVANPMDFMRVRSDRGVGLACLAETRTLIFSQLPYSRAEADALIAGMKAAL